MTDLISSLPQELITKICLCLYQNEISQLYTNEWNLKLTCKSLFDTVTKYQSKFKTIAFSLDEYDFGKNKRLLYKKHYMNLVRLFVIGRYITPTTLKEVVEWKGIETLMLSVGEWVPEGPVDTMTCFAEQIIGTVGILYMFRHINVPNLREFCIAGEEINHHSNYTCDNLPGMLYMFIDMIIEDSPNLKTITYSIKLKDKSEVGRYMNNIYTYHRYVKKTVKYEIETEKDEEDGILVQIKGQVEGEVK